MIFLIFWGKARIVLHQVIEHYSWANYQSIIISWLYISTLFHANYLLFETEPEKFNGKVKYWLKQQQ